MKKFKRTMAYLLTAALCISSFFPTAQAFAGAETGEAEEIVKEQETEEKIELQISVTEGKGSIQIEDEAGNISEATIQEPLMLECSPGNLLDIRVIPDPGYQIAFYKTMTDTGKVKEEITSFQPGEEGTYITQFQTDETGSIQAGFKEELSERTEEPADNQDMDERVEEIPAETEEEQSSVEQQREQTENSNESGETAAEKNTLPNFKVSREMNLLAPRETIYLDAGGRVYYYDYYTHWFHVDGRYAYCLEPREAAPSDGYYETTAMGEGLLRKAMYYVFGGPGYEVYTSTFGNLGSDNWNEESEYAMSHCIVAYCYTGDMDAFLGTPDELKEALLWEISNIESLPDPPASFEAFYFNMDGSGQTMGGCWDIQNGSIELQKSSGNQEWTEGNWAYGSLAGAEYGVYIQGTEEQVATLVTDEKGYARVDEIPEGNYHIRELKAPEGYTLDTASATVTVTAGQTVTYSCQDIPQSNPVTVLLSKIDAETNQNRPQGTASLADAEFTVKYYKGLYDTDPAQQGINPERTWVLKTKENGEVRLEDSGKVSGDDFYYMPNGQTTLPLGTVTVQETKAPAGYLLNHEIFIRQITSEGTAETVATYNQPTVPETPQKGVIRLQKVDSEINRAQAQGSLEGAVYEIRNSSDEVVGTLTTDKDGKAESGRLSLGTYTVKEKTASPGYQIDPQIYTVDLTAENTMSEVFYKSVTSKEELIRGGVAVEKWDSEKDKRESQGAADLEGTKIQIISQNDQEIRVEGKTYKKGAG